MKSKIKFKAAWIVKSLLLFLLLIFLIDSLGISRSFLKINSPIDSENIIIEGWINPDYHKEIVNIVKKGNYKNVIITGNPLSNHITLTQKGFIIIKPDSTNNSPLNISFRLKGTKANKEYPIARFRKNQNILFESTIKRYKNITIPDIELTSEDSISIEYTNDSRNKWFDRNLYLYSIKINKQEIPVHSDNVTILTQGKYEDLNVNFFSEYTARNLIKLGIDKNKITILNQNKSHSKTINSARLAVKWLETNHLSTANIITLDYHSKRTYLAHRKVATNTKFGIIPLSNRLYTPKSRQKLRTCKEILGILILKITPKIFF